MKHLASPLARTLLFCLLSTPLFSQNTHLTDSLQQRIFLEKNDSARAMLYNAMAYEFFNANLDSAESLIQKECFFARKSGCSTCLIECYRDKGFAENRRYRVDKALLMYDTAQVIAEKSKNWCQLSGVYSQKGGALNRKKDYEKALVWNQKSVEVYEANNCTGKGFVINYNLYVTLSNMGRDQECIAPLAKAIEVAERNGNTAHRQLGYGAMANELLNVGKWEGAEPFAQKSLELSRSLGDKYNEAQALFILGKSAALQDRFDIQYGHLQQARAALGESKDLFLKTSLWSSSALCAAFNEHYSEALELLAEAHPLAQKINSLPDILNCLRAYGKVYQMQNEPEKAEAYLLEAVHLTDRNPEQLQLRAISRNGLQEFYTQYGLWEKAYHAYKRFQELTDSMNNNEQRVQLAVLETEFRFHKERAEQDRLLSLRELDVLNLRNEKLQTDFRLAEQNRELLASQLEAEKQEANLFAMQVTEREKTLENTALNASVQQKEAENKAKTAEIALQNLQISRERWARWAIASLALAGLAWLFWLFKKRRRQDVLALRTDLARDLHDDLGSEISSLGLSAFSAARSGDAGRMTRVLEQVSAQSSRLVEDMRDLVWSMNPENDTLEKMLIRVRQNALRLLDGQEVSLKFDIAPAVASLRLAPEVHRQLFLMFKESLNNLAKYARCRSASVSVRKESGAVVFEVSDDGVGFDPAATEGGNGLRNLKERAAALRGSAEIVSEMSRGTVVRWRVPLG